jgi:hypothetical protein
MKKILLSMIVFLSLSYQCVAQEIGGNQKMYLNLKTDIKFSEKFDDLRTIYVSKYCVDMVILDRVQMEAITKTIFARGSTNSFEKDQSLFCIVRIYMDVEKSFNFIAHNMNISILDEDLIRHGFPRLRVGLSRPDEVFIKVIKFGVYDKERDKLLKKEKVEFFIDWLGFG